MQPVNKDAPRERGRPARPRAWPSQAGLLCLRSNGKGADSPLPPGGRAPRYGKSPAPWEAVARIPCAGRRSGRDARAPGAATTGGAGTHRAGPVAPLAKAGGLLSIQPGAIRPSDPDMAVP